MLTDQAGNVTDTYDYDAFGILINRTGSTPNGFLFAGEYLDEDTDLYYLRSRWYAPGIGRFYTMDSDEGNMEDPLTLHKYVYVANNPVNRTDPLGLQATIAGVCAVNNINMIISSEPLVRASNLFNFQSSLDTGIFTRGYVAVPPITVKHATVKIIPTDQDEWFKRLPSIFSNFDPVKKVHFATIGGFPSSRFRAGLQGVAGIFGAHGPSDIMVSRINDSYDISESKRPSADFEKSGSNLPEDAAINWLFVSNSNYKNNLDYTLYPKKSNEYNSNSYHLGLLDASQINRPNCVTTANGYPGANNPVPVQYFR